MPAQRSLIHLEGFEGPFDLLLELIRERKLDVSTLSLREITNDFLLYLETHSLRPEFLGDFLVVAATLLLLKAREVLPKPLGEEEEEEIEQLKARLALYHEYREQGAVLAALWQAAPLFSLGSFAPPVRVDTSGSMPLMAPAALANFFQGIARRLPKTLPVRLARRPSGKSLQECLDLFWSRARELQRLVFQQVVAGSSRQDVATSFLAILELARQQRVKLSQDTALAEIIIESA